MDTKEHTELGDALQFAEWDVLKENPYIHFDEKGTLHLDLQGISINGLPEQINLKLSAGTIISMSGDYFGGREVAFELPSITDFQIRRLAFDKTSKNLGEYLIKKSITSHEEKKLINSYKRLANSKVSQNDIDTIYKINNATYIPFSVTLNSYMQQLMFALRVKNYSEILNRNLSHFTPWSVRAYTIGHYIALNYASISYELQSLINKPNYQSNSFGFNQIRAILEQIPNGFAPENLQNLAHRYQALALGMEFFCFHYYTDHFAAGHVAFMGDLRALLPERFGIWGSILVNNLHDELNRVMIYTKKPYDPTPDSSLPPIVIGGDGNFNASKNYFNKQACIAGMQCSLQDLHYVFKGNKPPLQKQYGGLEHMPDVDERYRQPQPMILLGRNNKIYYRTNLNVIETLSPSQLEATYKSPLANGYSELSNKWQAFQLVFKLRVLPFIYEGKLQTIAAEKLKLLEEEENRLNPGRLPIQQPALGQQPATVPVWQTPAKNPIVMQALRKNSILSTGGTSGNQMDLEIEETQENLVSLAL